jgi:hypothetical protein
VDTKRPEGNAVELDETGEVPEAFDRFPDRLNARRPATAAPRPRADPTPDGRASGSCSRLARRLGSRGRRRPPATCCLKALWCETAACASIYRVKSCLAVRSVRFYTGTFSLTYSPAGATSATRGLTNCRSRKRPRDATERSGSTMFKPSLKTPAASLKRSGASG